MLHLVEGSKKHCTLITIVYLVCFLDPFSFCEFQHQHNIMAIWVCTAKWEMCLILLCIISSIFVRLADYRIIF